MSLWWSKGFHSTLSVLFTLHRHSASLSTFGIILTLITHTNGDKIKGSQTTLFLANNAKGGEILSPKQKDRTTTNLKIFEIKFSIGIFQISIPLEIISQLVSIWCQRFFNRYLKLKTLLKAKRRISSMGSFVLVTRKAFETGGENFKSWKHFQKNLQKQNKWCKCGPKY
jgi:hypothetical protein